VTTLAITQAASRAASPSAQGPRPRFGHLLEARLGPPSPPPASAGTPLAASLRSVEAAQARLDAVLAAARRGQSFSAGQLLALQADAHRLTQTLDVAGKLVEQGVQSVKQAVQTPV
jgi:hypothetical protein